ncbi:DoxX family protein [Nonlabens antarcticus]|uniref:DoxX family protein n=1 Tax=Nonlabens antarcticus TaxID=392714 RepID=UPI001890FE80|nr:DoxX family membrane protein [Nonlabens antarcticus]
MRELYNKTDYRSIGYAVGRIGMGSYLLFHAITSIMDMDQFMVTALSYFTDNSPISFLTYLTPIIPFMELFLAIMILMGLYTRIALKWAVGIGVFFMLFFQLTGDFASALEHSYGVTVKISLIFLIYYNKFSLDYYNLWKVSREIKSIQQRYR